MIHKLANGPLTLTVSDIASVEGNFGTQTQIDGEDLNGQEVRVFVSEMTAMRQLARLNLTPETVLGETLTLTQVKKDGKTFTDFVIGKKGAPSAAPAAPAAAPAPVKKMDFDEMVALYNACVKAAMHTLGVQCETTGVPIDASAIQAGAATLFIRASK
jgi:hypothetical protein